MEFYLKFKVPTDLRFLSVVRAAVGELGTACGMPEKDSCKVTLAVDEALTNIIRHAYHGEAGRPIEVTCQAFPDRLEFRLLDQGEPPDPVRLQGQPLNDRALGGRGCHLIRMIMDEVVYERVPDGNQLRLTKRLASADQRRIEK